jgi:superfamily II DNA or RNA helicase
LQSHSSESPQKLHPPLKHPSAAAAPGAPLGTPLVAGTRVRVRGSAWRIRKVQPFDSCTIVHLVGIDRGNSGQRRVLLDPFDRLQPELQALPLRVVRERRWSRALKGLLAVDHPWHGLRAVASSRVELIPFQLEPALASVRGLACRLLLADEVGLGKTIQAGLLISELRHRGLADRVLILTPSGLRRQWQAELSDRFLIHATVVDSPLLRRRASSLPAGTNPWIDDVAIASIDLIKRPDVMRELQTTSWDLVLVDEAHLAAQAAGRHTAAEVLAGRARHVVLITATPHSGNPAAFEALCRIGGADGSPLAIFRRSRPEVGLPSIRRVRTIAVTPRAEESHMHDRLRSYAQLVFRDTGSGVPGTREALLAMAVLTKRAASSPASLEISIARRLQMLSNEAPVEVQPALLLSGSGDDEQDHRDLDPWAVLGAPGLSDRAQEVICLREIAAAARRVPRGRKLEVLTRLVARIREPVLIFTEYRDTLQQVADALTPVAKVAVIHGGLTEAERVRAQVAFTSGQARVLLATDAAGEGLNLQARCRLVVNLELPWNPMRLEQRIGRVDRLGQTRVVHVINLFARGTAEAAVLARLVTRLDNARRGVGHVNDPLGAINLAPAEEDLASALLDIEEAVPAADSFNDRAAPNTGLESGGTSPQTPVSGLQPTIWHPDLRAEAIAETGRLESLRRLAWHAAIDHGATFITTMQPGRVRLPIASPSLVWMVRVRLVDGNGQLIEHVIVPLLGPAPCSPIVRKPRTLRAIVHTLLEAVRPSLFARALAIARQRLNDIADRHEEAVQAVRARELSLMRSIEAESHDREFFQAGLFDRRAARDREAARGEQSRRLGAAAARVKQLEAAGGAAVAEDAELMLVLQVAPKKTGFGARDSGSLK